MLFPTARTGKIATGEALGAGTGNESSLRNRKGGGGGRESTWEYCGLYVSTLPPARHRQKGHNKKNKLSRKAPVNRLHWYSDTSAVCSCTPVRTICDWNL